MSFNDFKENKLFIVKNGSGFSGITFANTLESYKCTSTYENKNKYSSIDYNTILLITYDHWNTLKCLIVCLISWYI